jgi:hypothetical protein
MEFNSIDSGELNAALAKAQAEMSNPKFDKANPHFRNKFASLAAVRDAVIPVLSKHGIACVQDLQSVEGAVSCTTILMHSSGQRMALGPLTMPVSKADAQGFGSAATYARRYHLMAVANVVGDEDDDANEATGKPGLAEAIPKSAKASETQYAVALKKAVAAVDADKTWAIHLDLHSEGEEFYRAVWDRLDSTTRAKAKDFIDLKKNEAKAA